MEPFDVSRLLVKFRCNPPASASSIARFEKQSDIRMPGEYASFLRRTDGGNGLLGDLYAIFWRLEELAEMNQAYEAAEYAPGFFLVGSNGGGEAFAFDSRSQTKPIVSIPFVGMAPDLALPVEPELRNLFKAIGHLPLSVPNETQLGAHQDSPAEIFEIKPVILGGSPTDPSNKVALTRQQHIEAVRFWNRIIREAKGKMNR